MTPNGRLHPERFARFDAACRRVPPPVVRRVFDEATRGLSIGLCLHRVSHVLRPTDPLPELTVSPTVLDDFLGMVFEPRNRRAAPAVTVTFDDGYLDAVEYVETRAARFPDADWVLFVCPDKLMRGAGFRWDLLETRLPPDEARRQMIPSLDRELDLEGENTRPELQALCRRPEFRLASVEQLRAAARHPNVVLGNHTDHHFRFSRLGTAAVRLEINRSHDRFVELFGPPTQFAFPFGVPGRDYDAGHAAAVRARGPSLLWSTEPRLFRREDRDDPGVLPRIPFLGGWHPHTIALWIARTALRQRARDGRPAAWSGWPFRASKRGFTNRDRS